MKLLHYTLNTGHKRYAYRDEILDSVLDVSRYIIKPGDHKFPLDVLPDYLVATGDRLEGFAFTVFYKTEPLVTCAVADTPEGAESVWPDLEELYNTVTDSGIHAKMDWKTAKQPNKLPWLSVAVVGSPRLVPAAAEWLGDFERCLAWTWLER